MGGSDPVAVKKYFYALRPALALRAMRMLGDRRPPMNLQQLQSICDLPQALDRIIDELVALKSVTNERGNARRYAGVLGFSGGLIGPPGTRFDYPGSLDGTPVFLGCSDNDSHIPAARVLESEAVFRRMSATVTRRLYPDMGHLVSDDEIAVVQDVIDTVLGEADPSLRS